MNVILPRRVAQAPTQKHPAGRVLYRADIDGLRAIAVLPVVLYHAGIPGFQGGFVGVDVFFVISGYLITSLIAGEIAEADFSLLHFYERRVRRIFPALFAMMTACAIFAWMFFMPEEFRFFGRSMRATALFTSNIQFARESGYFDLGAHMKPLLHTWSLAVEEQFYIIFPLLLVALSRFGRSRTIATLLLLFAASLAASAWGVFQWSTNAFFLSQFRAWELILGALLAFQIVPAPSRPLTRQVLAAFGVGLIATAVLVFNKSTPFPGLAALLPCLGAALVIHANAQDGLVGRALQTPALVFIGLISYSLYLWHWPLIVFSPYFTGHQLSVAQGSAIVVGSLILAAISWRFIEKPFRNHAGRVGRRPLFASAAVAMAAAAWFGNYVVAAGGMPVRLPAAVQTVYAATYDVSPFYMPGCFIDNDDNRGPALADIRSGKLCGLGREGATDPAFLVWGDSHAATMAPAIDAAAAEAGVFGRIAAHASCPPLPDVELPDRGETERCREFNGTVRDLIVSRHIPLVFLVAYWPKYVHDSELPEEGVFFDASIEPRLADKSAAIVEALDRLLADLKRHGTKVALVMDVPEMGRYVPEAVARAMLTGASTDVAPPWDYIAKRQALARDLLTKLAAKYGASIVDPVPAFCSTRHCNATRDGMPLYKDADHLTAAAARSLAYLYKPVFAFPVAHDASAADRGF
ncbi:acyltransferase family protein [Mesorhizobium sp. BAC0120]|uniref:acyltransferase family protein n=1 Tax=Mesorhizobium sp. BAC0120 TaxID=3090670 RepID=UPI00298C6EB4|nr:acyltransferase family protein [Mesorhizobium sp. BAC0120]MDW6024612.1 acyltransferase family protein [Mesorhizobium sp. BAC0120]